MKTSTSPFLDDLAAIAAEVVVVDDCTYELLGQKRSVAYQQSYTKWHHPLHQFGQNSGDESQLRANLLQHLAYALYTAFYCPGTTNRAALLAQPPAPPMPLPTERARTIELLSAANSTPNGADPLWTVYSIDSYGNAFVLKNGMMRQLVAGQWVFANPAETSLQVGSVVNITLAKEDTTVQPVFYHVRGTELVPQQTEFVRVYFNTTFEGARQLVQAITTTFNAYRLPFLFKCLNHPDLFTRTDSAVLYVSKFDFRLAQRLLQPILAELAPHLKTTVPLFTRPLRPGVSFSENPAGDQSFGMSRCSLVAEALVGAHYKDLPPTRHLAEIRRTLTKNGIEIDRIYLNPNSHFSYPLPASTRE